MAEIERDKQKYITMLDREWGAYGALVITGANARDLNEVKTLVADVTARDGRIGKAGVRRVNQTLEELGSPTRLAHISGRLREFARRFALPAKAIKPLRFVKVSAGDAERVDYLYVYQAEPSQAFKEYFVKPGAPLYCVGFVSLVRPIIEDVVSNAKAGDGVMLPSKEELERRINYAWYPPRLYGEEMPRVVRRDE